MLVSFLLFRCGRDWNDFVHLRATALVHSKFLSILPKKYIYTFSILHTQFYKRPTSIYLFYYLVYLNNNISLIFFIISNKPLPTWPHPPLSFFVMRRRHMREQDEGEREKRIKKSFAYEQ